MFLTTTYSSNYIMDRSPLESRVGELRIVPRPQHIEVDINESQPSHFSIESGSICPILHKMSVMPGGHSGEPIKYKTSSFACAALEFNFQGKTTRKGKHICASFTVDIPPSLHPRYAEECTYELIASVKILTTDAMGMESTIVRTGYAEIDISSKHVPLFINPLTPSGHGTSIFTLL
ncbi:hypothetical protein RhiXN_02614 [Rhizoctonia solani]|uniref:Uncharacterized protein n=1 Tax=Rhizoctonia solani TaxID=456999 RepID=A0A8H8NQX4_9AGAM|nr:uncharacterized protein RhiXN_02614 [Rhizoctonia solani]QRW17690.1 hypothetical protein RhiXN_02614 [Rhizoctonia solani]